MVLKFTLAYLAVDWSLTMSVQEKGKGDLLKKLVKVLLPWLKIRERRKGRKRTYTLPKLRSLGIFSIKKKGYMEKDYYKHKAWPENIRLGLKRRIIIFPLYVLNLIFFRIFLLSLFILIVLFFFTFFVIFQKRNSSHTTPFRNGGLSLNKCLFNETHSYP